MRGLDGVTDPVDMSLSESQEMVEDRMCCHPHVGCRESDVIPVTEQRWPVDRQQESPHPAPSVSKSRACLKQQKTTKGQVG